MSDPNPQAEYIEHLHAEVYEYVNHFVGEPSEEYYLREEINHPEKRTERFELYLEYLNN